MNTWKKVKIISSNIIGPNVKSVVVLVSNPKFKPGQYFDIRLSKNKSFRSYSVASGGKNTIEFGIQLLPNGQVSPHLFSLRPGDLLEVRGPIGNHFVLDEKTKGDIILIGGGSGAVPLMSILRTIHKRLFKQHIVMLISARVVDSILYKKEVDEFDAENVNVQTVYTITGKIPDNWSGFSKRIDKKLLSGLLLSHASHQPTIYIAGPTSFVENIMNNLLSLKFSPSQIKTERFGGLR